MKLYLVTPRTPSDYPAGKAGLRLEYSSLILTSLRSRRKVSSEMHSGCRQNPFFKVFRIALSMSMPAQFTRVTAMQIAANWDESLFQEKNKSPPPLEIALNLNEQFSFFRMHQENLA